MVGHRNIRLSDRLYTIVLYVICIVVLIVIIYPLYFVIIASISTPAYVTLGKVWLRPKGITFLGYREIFKDQRIWTGYRNTLIYSVSGTLLTFVVVLPAAYAMSRKKFMVRNPLMIFFVITMFFNGGMIPTYLVVLRLGLVDTVGAILLPVAFNAFYMIIARTFFASTIPLELYDTAEIDGCSQFQVFIKIVLPLSNAIVAVIGLYSLVGHWNSYFPALMYIRRKSLKPLQIILRDILIRNQMSDRLSASYSTIDEELQQIADTIKYGVIIVSTLPVMVFYPFLQKYFAKGVMIGALKG